jgi:hypothetical protein
MLFKFDPKRFFNDREHFAARLPQPITRVFCPGRMSAASSARETLTIRGENMALSVDVLVCALISDSAKATD